MPEQQQRPTIEEAEEAKNFPDYIFTMTAENANWPLSQLKALMLPRERAVVIDFIATNLAFSVRFQSIQDVGLPSIRLLRSLNIC